jgi:hypothetical protein
MRPPKLQRRLVDREGPKRRLRDYVDITTGLPPRAADFLQCPSRQSRASLGGFRTPAPRARGIIREGPASETLHTSGLMRRSKTHRHIDSPPPLAIDSDQIFFRELARHHGCRCYLVAEAWWRARRGLRLCREEAEFGNPCGGLAPDAALILLPIMFLLGS